MPTFKRLILVLLIMATGACAGTRGAVVDRKPDHRTGGTAPVHLFRTFLSGADGQRCPMTPSCSSYALTAIQRHGALMGWIMTVDRLMRCGRDELTRCQTVQTSDGARCPDTVENNDFWWY